MAYDGSLIFDTKIDNKGFEKGVGALKSTATGAMKVVGGLMLGATTAITGVGIASIKVGSTFTSSMSQVAATMGITVDEIKNGSKSFEMLKQAAKDAGATTQYSASESAEALNYLALAGYDAEKAVEALPKVLNLAAAGGMELAYTSDLITDSMSALGLEMNELDGFVDQLAKTSQKSNTNVGQLGEAILTVGGTAKILKGGTVELNTQLGILADNGIKGSEGGTALRNVLLSLSAPTDKQAAAMKSLGIETYDASGKLKSTDEIFQELNGTLGDMTDKERTEVLSKLFNKVDLKAANALLDGSGERFGELSEQIANSDGAAADMAATLNDNLTGKITILKSALEGLGIEIFEGLDMPLQQVTETANIMIDRLSNALQNGGFSGLVEEVGAVLSDVLTSIAEATPMMLEKATGLVMAFLEGINSNKESLVTSFVEVLSSMIESILTIFPQFIVLGLDLLANFMQGMAQKIPELIPMAMTAIDTIFNGLMTNIPIILEAGIAIILALVDGISDNAPQLMAMAIDLVVMVADKIIENLPKIIQSGLKLLTSLVKGIMDNLPKLISEVPRIINSFADTIYSNLPKILMAGIKIIGELILGLLKAIPTLVANIPAIIMAIVNVFTLYNWWNLGKSVITKLGTGISSMVSNIGTIAKNLATNAINAIKGIFTGAPAVGSGFIRGIMSGISSLASSLVSLGGTMARNALTAIRTAFSNAPSIGSNMVKGIWNGISNVTGWILSKIKGFGTSVMKGIKNIFGIKSPSTKMRDEVGKNLILGMGAGIEKEVPALQRDIDKEMSKLTARMKSTVEFETSNNARSMTGSSGYSRGSEVVTNNNDNGVVQNVTIVSPQGTPSENARQMKKMQKEIAYGY